MACQNGHQEIAKWLWIVCPEQEQSEMLHACDDSDYLSAFERSCKSKVI